MKLELTEAPLLWFRVFHSDRATEAPRCSSSSLKVADEQGKEVSRASSCEDFFFFRDDWHTAAGVRGGQTDFTSSLSALWKRSGQLLFVCFFSYRDSGLNCSFSCRWPTVYTLLIKCACVSFMTSIQPNSMCFSDINCIWADVSAYVERQMTLQKVIYYLSIYPSIYVFMYLFIRHWLIDAW